MARTLHRAGVHVALAAMLLRALLPAGWMPNPKPSSGSLLTICTMSGLIYLKQPADNASKNDGGPHKGAHHHEMCPFAAAAHLARGDSAGFALVGSMHSQRLVLPAPATVRYRIAFRAYAPRAPPQLREI